MYGRLWGSLNPKLVNPPSGVQVLKEAEREKELEILRTGAVATDNLQVIGEDEDGEEEVSYEKEEVGSDSEPEIQVGLVDCLGFRV